MIYRRGVLGVLLLLALVVAGFVIQVVRGPADATPTERSATPTPTPVTGAARAVTSSLAGVERAYAAGDVRRLCRPGALLDPAVIVTERRGCESRLESLMANVPRLRVTIRSLIVRPDLATVTTGTGANVDFVRRGGRWLLSFSDGADPLPALAGTT